MPKGSESHFKVVVVSDIFEGKSIIDQHREVNSVLKEELKQIHALAIQTKTTKQWEIKQSEFKTPKCEGGEKKEQN